MIAVKVPMENDIENHALETKYQKSLRTGILIPISLDSILGTDLADMQLISKCNKELDLHCPLLIFTLNTLGEFHGKIMSVKQLYKHPKAE